MLVKRPSERLKVEGLTVLKQSMSMKLKNSTDV